MDGLRNDIVNSTNEDDGEGSYDNDNNDDNVADLKFFCFLILVF